MQGQSFVLSILYLPLKTTSALLNLAFLFRIVEIFSGLTQSQIFASHHIALLIDQEAFSIWLYVCNKQGNHINCVLSFSVLRLTLRPCPIKNNYQWL